MKPIIKYQGGKTRELPIIKKLAPTEFNRIIEPFAGGAAVSFAYEKPAILCDINDAVLNLYMMVRQPGMYHEIFSHVNWLKTLNHDELEVRYYKARDNLNDQWGVDAYTYAIAYLTVRQLCFSGMERYNKQGDFNVPFGHYKKFSCNLDWNHMKYLQECQICRGFHEGFDRASYDDWIFIDPPYRDRLGYTQGDGGGDLHDELVDRMIHTQTKWLFIHTECDYYKEKLKDFNIIIKPFGYGQRFGKNKNHANASVSHMYVTNYDTDMTLHYVAQPSLLEICNNGLTAA